MKDYKHVYVSEIIQELKSASGRNDKIEILKSALATNADFLIATKLTYNPYKNFYISSLDAVKKVANFVELKNGYRGMIKGFNILESLNAKGSSNNSDKRNLAYALEEMSDHDIRVFDLILHRSFDCGVSVSSINAARPGTIPEFKVMLCEKFNQKSLSNIEYPAIAQVKMDGMRVIVFVEDQKVTLRTRNGKTVETHHKLDKDFLKLVGHGGSTAIDGELLVLKSNSLEYENRKTGNGICNKSIRGSISPEEADRLVFVAWDIVSTKTFWGEASTIPYFRRFNVLTDLIHAAGNSKIKLVESIECIDYYEVQRYYEIQLAKGQEGIILKNRTAQYEPKRSKHCIKFKAENTADLLIVEVIEGAGKYIGRLGSFRCTTSDGIITVNVGSGLTDLDREEYFTNNMVGQIIEVKYNEVIQTKFGDKSLFLPIFQNIRKDKSIANTAGELK